MSIEIPQQSEAQSPLRAAAHGGGLRHGSSRMLESYLRDIEYLMREQLWASAAPLALALPHICAALSNTDLVSSGDAYRSWCEAWVRPERDDTSLCVPSPEELSSMSETFAVEPELTGRTGVPVRSLRQLRLRRLSRAVSPRGRGMLVEMGAASDEPASEACVALLDAVRRWYGDWAAGSPTVQTNLARLAVLR
jgi:hypothetical protein